MTFKEYLMLLIGIILGIGLIGIIGLYDSPIEICKTKNGMRAFYGLPIERCE